MLAEDSARPQDEAEGLAWAREGAGIGKPWLGDTFWSNCPHNPRPAGVGRKAMRNLWRVLRRHRRALPGPKPLLELWGTCALSTAASRMS